MHILIFTGSPTPKVEWFIDEDLIPSDDDYYEMTYTDGHARLYMKTVDVHDEGEYLLVATNDYGSASTSCELTIKGKSSTIIDQTNLQCISILTKILLWFMYLELLRSFANFTHNILIICLAGEGEAPVFTSMLEPLRIHDGEKTTMTVTYTAKPAPNVQWFRNDALLVPTVDFEIVTDSSTSTLVIEDTMLEDAGLYKVVLTNPHGDAVCAVSVEVVEEAERVEQTVQQIAEVILEEEVQDEQEVSTMAPVTEQITATRREPVHKKVETQQAVQSVNDQTLETVTETSEVTSKTTKTESTSVVTQQSEKTSMSAITAELEHIQPEEVVLEEVTVPSSKPEVNEEIVSMDKKDKQQPTQKVTPIVSEDTLEGTKPEETTTTESSAPVETSVDFETGQTGSKVSETAPVVQTEELQETKPAEKPQTSTAQPDGVTMPTETKNTELQPSIAPEQTIQEEQHSAEESVKPVVPVSQQPTEVFVAQEGTTSDTLHTEVPALISEQQLTSAVDGVKPVEPVSQKPSDVVVQQDQPSADTLHTDVSTTITEQQLTKPGVIHQTQIDASIPQETDIPTSTTDSETRPAVVPLSESTTQLQETKSLTAESTEETHSKDEVVPLEEKVSPSLQLSEAKETVEETPQVVTTSLDAVKPSTTDLKQVTVETETAKGQKEPASASTMEETIDEAETKPIISTASSTTQEAKVDLPHERASSEQPIASVDLNVQTVDVLEASLVQGFEVESTIPEETVVSTSKPDQDTLTSTAAPVVESAEMATTQEIKQTATDSTIPEQMEVTITKPEVTESKTLQKPSISNKSEQLDFELNQDMELSVEYTGKPVPDVTWYKDDEEVKESKRLM